MLCRYTDVEDEEKKKKPAGWTVEEEKVWRNTCEETRVMDSVRDDVIGRNARRAKVERVWRQE